MTSPPTKAPSGNVVFKVKNTGNEVTEFYLYGEDGLRIVGEIENIGPGLSRDLVVRAPPGKYVTACKPGMKGQGIRVGFTVTDSGKDTAIKGVDQADDRRGHHAVRRLRQGPVAGARRPDHGVRDGVQGRRGRQGPRAVPAGARPLGAHRARGRVLRRPRPARWTCARPTSRRARSGPAGTGSRRTCGRRPRATSALTPPSAPTYADDLLANTKVLAQARADPDYTVDQIGNGSKGLLDEVATGKITGEEDIWSHTDL